MNLYLVPTKHQVLGMLRQNKTKSLLPRDLQSNYPVRFIRLGLEGGVGSTEIHVRVIKMEMISEDTTIVCGC